MGKKKNRKRRTESMRMNVLIFSVQFNSKMVQVTAILYSRNLGHAWNISNFMHTEKRRTKQDNKKQWSKSSTNTFLICSKAARDGEKIAENHN